MTKKEARKEFIARRNQLTAGEYFQLNQRVYNYFFSQVDLSFVRTMHLFLSMEGKHEPDTWLLLDRLRREYTGVRLVIPKMKNDGTLEHFYFEGMQQFKVNSWGIAEPETGIPATVEKIDMVVVPLLACDQAGNRVGYGKGYYDQFLKQCRNDCQKIGLSLFDPVEQIDDPDPWDVPLNQCITPHGIVIFK